MDIAEMIALASLDNLFRRYGVDLDGIATEVVALEQSTPDALGNLLRSHLLKGINNKETEFRSRLDGLLAYYSYLELLYMTGAIKTPGARREELATKVLNIPVVKRYYERLYPLTLPGALRLRLANKAVLNVPNFDVASVLISQGYELANDDVEMFLDLVDEYTFDDVGLDDLFSAMSSPVRFARLLVRPPDDDDVLASGARGMIQFLRFSTDFDELLASIPDQRLRSAIWHLHGYWYELTGGTIYGALSTLIERLRDWVPKQPNEKAFRDELDETLKSMDQNLLALKRLTSSVYRYHYEKAYLSAVAGENEPQAMLRWQDMDIQLKGDESETT